MGLTAAEYYALCARKGWRPDPRIIPATPFTESALHQSISEQCSLRRWIPFHGSTAHATHRTIGEPDFTILADKGRVFFMEVKSRTGKLTTEQLGLQHWARILGHEIHVVRSLQEFMQICDRAK